MVMITAQSLFSIGSFALGPWGALLLFIGKFGYKLYNSRHEGKGPSVELSKHLVLWMVIGEDMQTFLDYISKNAFYNL